MSIHIGPNVRRTNLIAEWDAANIVSYSNNRLSVQGSALEGIQGDRLITTFPVNGGNTLTRIGYGQTIGDYTVKASDVVYRYDLRIAGCSYSGNIDYVQSGTFITVTFDYFVSEDADEWGRFSTGLFALENYGGGAVFGGINAPNTTKGVWQTVTQTYGPTSSNGTQAMFIYPGLCSFTRQSNRGFLYFKNPQVVYSSSVPNSSYNAKPNSMVWYDTSGNAYDGTKTVNAGYGGPVVWRSPGFFDFSVNIPVGNNAYTNNGFSLSQMVVPTTGSFTLTAYGKRDAVGKALGDRETIFSNSGGGDGWRFGPFQSSGVYYLIGTATLGIQEGSIGTTNTADSNWHAVSLVYDRNAVLGSYTVYAYVDGYLIGSSAIGGGAPMQSIPFQNVVPGIGWQGCCSPFAGQLSYLSVYNTALSSSDILTLHSTLKGRFSV
jgi:hypothetical protein